MPTKTDFESPATMARVQEVLALVQEVMTQGEASTLKEAFSIAKSQVGLTRPLLTEEVAAATRYSPGYIRVLLCRTGSFHGVVPDRAPGGRLLWPPDTIERLQEIARAKPVRVPPGPRSRQRAKEAGREK